MGDHRFVVELIKPSHYDDDGYVIQWWKSWIPSNSLACLYGIATDLAERHAWAQLRRAATARQLGTRDPS